MTQREQEYKCHCPQLEQGQRAHLCRLEEGSGEGYGKQEVWPLSWLNRKILKVAKNLLFLFPNRLANPLGLELLEL